MADELHPVRVTLGAAGHASEIEIAGVDVARFVRRIEIDAEPGHPTIVRLELMAGVELSADAARVLARKGKP